MPRRVLQGIVVSDKNHKTITVRTERFVKHPLYKKFVKLSKKYSAHDETNDAKLGDKVAIIECAPISKSKTWTLHRVLDRSIAAQAAAEAAAMVAKIDAEAADAAAARALAAADEAAAAETEAAAASADEQPDAP